MNLLLADRAFLRLGCVRSSVGWVTVLAVLARFWELFVIVYSGGAEAASGLVSADTSNVPVSEAAVALLKLYAVGERLALLVSILPDWAVIAKLLGLLHRRHSII